MQTGVGCLDVSYELCGCISAPHALQACNGQERARPYQPRTAHLATPVPPRNCNEGEWTVRRTEWNGADPRACRGHSHPHTRTQPDRHGAPHTLTDAPLAQTQVALLPLSTHARARRHTLCRIHWIPSEQPRMASATTPCHHRRTRADQGHDHGMAVDAGRMSVLSNTGSMPPPQKGA